MKCKKSEVVLRFGAYRIEKRFDHWGGWDYALFKSGQFCDKSWSFEILKAKMLQERV